MRRFDDITADRIVWDYAQFVCAKPAVGDFMFILRTALARRVPWPSNSKVEDVWYFALARLTKILFINKPMLVYYDHEGDKTADNMTGMQGFLGALDLMAEGTRDVLAQHKATLLDHCPPRYSRYCASLALYYLMQGKTAPAIPCLVDALRYGTLALRVKTLVFACFVPLPLFLRRKMFVFAWRFR